MKRWALILGGKGAGKSSTTKRVAERLNARGVAIGGVFQPALYEDGERVGYVARRVDGPDSCVLAWRGAAPSGTQPETQAAYCSFVFNQDAFASARTWIRAAASEAEVVVIDEVSALEVGGGGHHDAIQEALQGQAIVLLSVRADQLFGVMERFGLDEPVAYVDAGDESELEAFVAQLASAVAVGSQP